MKLTGFCGHCAFWKGLTLERLHPSMRGTVGADSGPMAVIRCRRRRWRPQTPHAHPQLAQAMELI
jgi:hypothetical protein